MNLFQWLTLSVVAAVLAAEFLGLCRKSAGRKSRLLRIAVWSAAAAAIVDPGIPQAIAIRIGIGRGADLVLYLVVLAFLRGVVLLLLLLHAVAATAYGSGASPGNTERAPRTTGRIGLRSRPRRVPGGLSDRYGDLLSGRTHRLSYRLRTPINLCLGIAARLRTRKSLPEHDRHGVEESLSLGHEPSQRLRRC